MAVKKIVTLIVTYNGMPWLQECLRSLMACSTSTDIVIIDNASVDETVTFVRKEYPTILMLEQVTNLGFGKANNIGMRFALKNGVDYVFLINQDVKVENDTLKSLIIASNSNGDYGILSPLHFNWKGDCLEYYFKQFLMQNADLYSNFLLQKKLNDIYDVPFVNAAAWLIPRNTLDIIGGFDPIFHHYGEDNNYCQRLTYQELKIGIVPDSKIYHDSRNRSVVEVEFFSKTYFNIEIKQLQLKYADINRDFSSKDRNELRIQQLKIILRNLLKLNFKNCIGYFKKLMIFEKEYLRIKESRKINTIKGKNYII